MLRVRPQSTAEVRTGARTQIVETGAVLPFPPPPKPRLRKYAACMVLHFHAGQCLVDWVVNFFCKLNLGFVKPAVAAVGLELGLGAGLRAGMGRSYVYLVIDAPRLRREIPFWSPMQSSEFDTPPTVCELCSWCSFRLCRGRETLARSACRADTCVWCTLNARECSNKNWDVHPRSTISIGFNRVSQSRLHCKCHFVQHQLLHYQCALPILPSLCVCA